MLPPKVAPDGAIAGHGFVPPNQRCPFSATSSLSSLQTYASDIKGGARSHKLLVGLRKPINSDFHPVILHNVLPRPKPHRHIGLLDPPYALVRKVR
jgi:hypothetical protein